VNDVLVLDSSRFNGGDMMIHYHISAWKSRVKKIPRHKYMQAEEIFLLYPEPRSSSDDSDQHFLLPKL
jgi:hypothetical protein